MESRDLSNLRIVLVGTTHPGNIGAAARAMKTMGLSSLALVKPRSFPSADATARASGADDILEQALICDSITEAVNSCSLVIATTARLRAVSWPLMSPREMTEKIRLQPASSQTAIIFGRENSGLTNEELAFCQAAVKIPTNDSFSSLNLAAAVQIIAYELRLGLLVQGSSDNDNRTDPELATAEQMERFYTHLEETMTELEFYDPANPRLLMLRLRRLFNRVQMEQSELQILRGLLKATQKKIG